MLDSFTRRRALSRVLLVATAACFAVPCFGWGREGHRLTALVAESYLTPQTRNQIQMLLAADPESPKNLVDIANWADEYRQDHPETAGWHYVDIPGAAPSFDRLRDCPATTPPSPWRDCVTDRINYFEGRLADTTLSLRDRAIALKFLVHLLGDVHQPFHAIGDAHGGNQIHVTFLGASQCGSSPCNLHGVWDSEMIDRRGLSEPKYLESLRQQIDGNHWERLAGGSPTLWANASHHYAGLAQVPDGSILPRAYYEEEIKIVDAQLALGGLRLARVLNNILGDQTLAMPSAVQPR